MTGDRYVLERRRRLFHLIPPEQTAPPYTSRCGRQFPIPETALQAAQGDGGVCTHCRLVQPARRPPRS